MKKGKIIVVEDDNDIRSLETMLLTDEGYEVFEAANGEEALLFFRTNPEISKEIKLIVLDLMMPKMNGVELIKVIRSEKFENPAVSQIPILVTSADANIQSKVGKEQNIYWIAKPVDLDALLAAVAKHF